MRLHFPVILLFAEPENCTAVHVSTTVWSRICARRERRGFATSNPEITLPSLGNNKHVCFFSNASPANARRKFDPSETDSYIETNQYSVSPDGQGKSKRNVPDIQFYCCVLLHQYSFFGGFSLYKKHGSSKLPNSTEAHFLFRLSVGS